MSLRRSLRIKAAATTATSNIHLTHTSSSAVLNGLKPPKIPQSPPLTADIVRPNKRARTSRTAEHPNEEEDDGQKSAKRHRRTVKEPVQEPTPESFLPRKPNLWKIGPHVSSAGGVENAIVNAAAVGANAFAIFLKSQRKWESNPMKEESVTVFKARLKAFGYSPSHILPHGSYLVNLGNPDEEKREKSLSCFLDDLRRCEQLGLQLYNFHPGSTVGVATLEESIAHIAECINRAHRETEHVVIVLENMAGAGNVIGSRFSELGDIIKQVNDKTRVGVCLDTCHMYAAGYDITTPEGWRSTMHEFDREIGMSYLRGMHLNDSKGALASKKDRHENIGLGHLGLRTFAHLLSDPRTRDIPLILETPAYDVPSSSANSKGARERLATEGMTVWRTEVAVLNRLSGRSPSTGVSGSQEGGDPELAEEELQSCKAEIEEAVRQASAAKDAKGKKAAVRSDGGKKDQKGKGKARSKAREQDDDEQLSSCDELETEH